MLENIATHGARVIWIDVTTSYRWTSTPVGIVRTEIEIAKYLLEKSSVKLCRWNGKGWQEITRSHYQQKVATLIAKKTNPIRPKRNTLKSIGIKIAKIILVGPMQRFTPSLKAIASGCLGVLKEIHYLAKKVPVKIEQKLNGQYNRMKDVVTPFNANDIYIAMGLDWDDKNLDVIREAKKKYGFKYVGVCYDLIPIFYPHFIVPGYRGKLTSHFVNMVWNAEKVMCISKFSENQMQYFSEDICLKKIVTDYFYLGSELSSVETHSSPSSVHRYCLYVSTIEPRKNHELLYKVWDLLVQRHGKEKVPKLIFVGKRGWLIDNLLEQIQKNPNTHDKIVIQEHVSDADLASLYDGALFTLFPSYVEGWGLPISESLHYGKVCLHSDTSSMPEASQNLVISKSPFDVLGWLEVVEQLTFNHQFRQDMERKIKSSYRPVNWCDTAETFYRSVEKL